MSGRPLSQKGGMAELEGQGATGLADGLALAGGRMPTLAHDTRVGRIASGGAGSRAITFNDLPATAPARRVQQPALFDFNPRPSTVVLRRDVR